jgi:YidC/Oxa1 family membrane protein insertase
LAGGQQQLITKRVMDEARAKAKAEMENKPVEIDVVRKDRKKRPRKKA